MSVDGISLTVAALSPAWFGVQVIPFTWSHTAIGATRVGDAVNLEMDVIGKYVARLLELRVLPEGEPAALIAGPARRTN